MQSFKKLHAYSPKTQSSESGWRVNEWLKTMSRHLFRAGHRMLWSKINLTPNSTIKEGSFTEMTSASSNEL